MSEEEFLQDFINWFSKYIDNQLIEIKSKYSNELTVKRSLIDICNSYAWDNMNFKDTNNVINYLSKNLREAKDQDKATIALKILEWGGVSNKNKDKLENLSVVLKEAATYINLPKIDKFEIPMSSGFSKIYSLYFDEFIIYDSRVAASLCLFIYEYLKERKLEAIPNELLIGYSNGKVSENSSEAMKNRRNPNYFINSSSYPKINFPVFSSSNQKKYFEYNIKASRLIKHLVINNIVKFKEKSINESMRIIESSLFMIGYDLSMVEIKNEL